MPVSCCLQALFFQARNAQLLCSETLSKSVGLIVYHHIIILLMTSVKHFDTKAVSAATDNPLATRVSQLCGTVQSPSGYSTFCRTLICKCLWFQGRWSQEQLDHSIQWKELYPLVLAACVWEHSAYAFTATMRRWFTVLTQALPTVPTSWSSYVACSC